ncbi:MAG: response regulator [Campylobacterota bacterium]|nr:response regulator [Campylobacterota bacterium]
MGKILIVDDSVTVRLYHKQILQGAGYEIDEAENGMEALEKTSENEYDLFLVDINMPILDGYSFVRRFRENSGYGSSIVMISTESEKSDRTIAYEAGANFYEVKPVSSDDLLRVAKLLTVKNS